VVDAFWATGAKAAADATRDDVNDNRRPRKEDEPRRM